MAKKIRSKAEQIYLNRVSKFSHKLITHHKDSPQEGFEYFKSREYLDNYNNNKSLIMSQFLSSGFKSSLYMSRLFSKHILKLFKGRTECYTDLKNYLKELELNGYLSKGKNQLVNSYPNAELWNKLCSHAYNTWGLTLGFTKLPEQLIFKGKTVLFRYAIVCIQEMKKSEIDQAPTLPAGGEAMRIYKELGLAVNDLARYLRSNYNISCQSNHPMGGLTNTAPLAAKAGLGWQGHNGLLITPQYGQRQRIAPIFIEDKMFEFTDSNNHKWIEEFCKTCRTCEKSCPVGAIYPQKIISANNIPGIEQTRTCIDRIKCYPQFTATLGCSICIKVCPFSQGDNAYSKIMKGYAQVSKPS